MSESWARGPIVRWLLIGALGFTGCLTELGWLDRTECPCAAAQGRCLDLRTDEKNCGACGHACEPDRCTDRGWLPAQVCRQGSCQQPEGSPGSWYQTTCRLRRVAPAEPMDATGQCLPPGCEELRPPQDCSGVYQGRAEDPVCHEAQLEFRKCLDGPRPSGPVCYWIVTTEPRNLPLTRDNLCIDAQITDDQTEDGSICQQLCQQHPTCCLVAGWWDQGDLLSATVALLDPFSLTPEHAGQQLLVYLQTMGGQTEPGEYRSTQWHQGEPFEFRVVCDELSVEAE